MNIHNGNKNIVEVVGGKLEKKVTENTKIKQYYIENDSKYTVKIVDHNYTIDLPPGTKQYYNFIVSSSVDLIIIGTNNSEEKKNFHSNDFENRNHKISVLFEEAIKKFNNINTTYLKIDLSTVVAGLSHQKCNFMVLIRYCFDNNLKLIKPIFRLERQHNNNKELKGDFSKYFDLDGITVNGKSFKLYDDNDTYTYTHNHKKYKCNLLKNNPIFKNYVKNEDNWKVVIPYKQDIINIAKRVSKKLGEYMCIHVRRGDKIKESTPTKHPTLDIDTQPDNIIKKINEYKLKNIYIMTNRINEVKSVSDMKNRNIYFYTNYNFLETINDNYYLFCIEKNIMEFAKIRCATFRTGWKYYDCSLLRPTCKNNNLKSVGGIKNHK